MMGHGYNQIVVDHCVYVRNFYDDNFNILLLYFDDMLIVGHETEMIDRLKERSVQVFWHEGLSVCITYFGHEDCLWQESKEDWKAPYERCQAC